MDKETRIPTKDKKAVKIIKGLISIAAMVGCNAIVNDKIYGSGSRPIKREGFIKDLCIAIGVVGISTAVGLLAGQALNQQVDDGLDIIDRIKYGPLEETEEEAVS